MENNIYCGICGEKMNKDSHFFVCNGCNVKRDGRFLKSFFAEKYRDKIKKIEITNVNSAKIYFQS